MNNESETNCPNCGAPLKSGKCEYCGTEKEQKPKTRLLITADSITVITE